MAPRSNRGVGLTQIYPPPSNDADTDIDVIAIHGLDTKYPGEDVNWLACPRMLPERVGPARIFTCDWPADLLEQPDLIQKTADEFARLLLAGIKRHPLPTKAGYAKGDDRPIVFIVSCLGGIILIKALVIAGHSSEYAVVRQSTRGIIFLATPFRGTSFQNVADWAEPGLRAWASIRGRKVSSLLDDVKGSTFHLEELVRQFTQLCRDKDYPYQVATFYELGLTSLHHKFPLSWLIPSRVLDVAVPPKPLVDSSSATLDIVADPLPLNRRHVMMNKFNGPEDPDYQCVAGKIAEILQDIRTNSPLDDADAWIRNKHYTVDRLKIERLSGDQLPMDQCYINLAIKTQTPDATVQVELATLFNPRQKRNGEMTHPRRILIRGRAGVGKTTLCKKIVHEFTKATWSGWNDLFDRILWIPLRNLKLEERRQQPAYDFEALLAHEYFSLPNNKPDFAKHLAQALETSTGRTLFLHDGLDEVSQDLAGNSSMSRFLNEFLEQPNIIVTSRPSARLPLNLDLELETIGFYPDQVTKIDEKTVDKIQSFLRDHWLIKGLVRIPIQLDALCYSWADIHRDMPETMTALYQAIELRLWKKDIVRLEKTHNHVVVTPYHIQVASRRKIEDFMKDEIAFLEQFEPKHLNLISDSLSGFLPDKTALSLSFLRASSTSLGYDNRSYHFIHLTFQEYFAARYFVRQWTAREPLDCVEFGSGKTNKIEPIKFLKKYKYSVRHGILWRFVAGLLDAELEQVSLFLQKIEEEPLDLLGPVHQRLVVHCLSEISSILPIRTSLEQRLSGWLIFECEITKGGHSYLASEVEFPEQALDAAFREGSDNVKKKILGSVVKRTTAPANIIEQAVSWLSHAKWYFREISIESLRHLILPSDILESVSARLEDEDPDVRQAAIKIVCQQPILSKEILEAVAARLEDEHPTVRKVTAAALGRQLTLPDEILKAVAARLEDEHPTVRESTAVALGRRLTLPDEILKAVAARIEDEDLYVRVTTIEVLCRQPILSKEILEAVAACFIETPKVIVTQLEDRVAAIDALGKNSNLSIEILEAIATQLKRNQDRSIQVAAIKALGKQSSIPGEILKIIAPYLEDIKDKLPLKAVAVSVLGNQSDLPYEIRHTLVAQLKVNDRQLQEAAIKAFDNQSSLPDEILNAIAALLEDNDWYTQLAAVKALGSRTNLPNKLIKAITAQLGDNEHISAFQEAVTKALGNQSSLPSNDILDAMAAQLKSDYQFIQQSTIEALGNFSNLPDKYLHDIAARLDDDDALIAEVAERTLRKRKEFYLTLLKGPRGPVLYRVLLRRSFEEELTWCVDGDGGSVIDIPGEEGIVFGKQYDVRTVIKGIRPVNYPVS
ncbi:hypothetical protein ACQKWADRAFT_319153 [Trichoderma austrokoningii]